MTGSILTNVLVVLGIYLILGTSGYFVFKGDTKDNILSNFASNEVLATISKFGLTIQLIISFATLHFLCRSSFETVLFTDWPFTWFRFFLLEFILITVMSVIALSFNEIITVFSLTGAIAGVLVFFVFPVILYIRTEPVFWKKIPAVIVLILSIILGLIGTVSVSYSIIRKFIKK